ncbi:MAG: dihydroorotate dehydrogenase electron transfer subunit [Armatimonadota bacterium]
MIYTKCKITENKEVAEGYFLIKFFSKEIVRYARAGQFVQVKITENTDPLLMRPFSFFEIDRIKKTFSILYQIKGKGTKFLSGYPKGKELNILGPLGSYFKYPKYIKNVILIAGGVGIAPLACFADELARCKKDVTVLLGLKERSMFNFLKERCAYIPPTGFLVSVEGGVAEADFKGTVVNFFENIYSAQKKKYDYACTCGPNSMLKEVQRAFSDIQIPVYCSLEAHMTCGMGVCLGCAVKIKEKNTFIYKKICSDGPVFNLRNVVF